jgi:hypothetical protein
MSLDRGEASESNFNISPPSAFLKSMGWPQDIFRHRGSLIGWSVVPAREKFARLQPERLPIKTLSNSPSPGDHGGTGGERRRLIL